MAIGRIPEPGTGIPESIVDAKGDIVTATAGDTPARLAVGSNETRLVADSAQATGLKYVADTTNYAIAAKGDLLVGTAADTLQALSVGTNGHTLVADSAEATGLKWAAPASGSTFAGWWIYNLDTSISIANNTNVIVTFGEEEFDTNGFHSTTTNTSRVTIPSGQAGYYLCYGKVDYTASTNNKWGVSIKLNGADSIAAYQEGTVGGDFLNQSQVVAIAYLAEGDYLEIEARQISGGTVNIISNNSRQTNFRGFRIGS